MQKWGSLAGAVFAIALVAGAMLMRLHDSDATDQEVIDWYIDGGHQASLIAAAYLFTVAALASTVFVAIGVRPRIESASSDASNRAIGSLCSRRSS